MSTKRRRREHVMLETWRPPRGSGDPVGCLATTFTFDAGFFEEECLARFLEIDSLPGREDLAYLLERETKLGQTYAGVLVDDRQAGVDHSLRWDVLPVRVPRGKQHAKLSLLVWTNRIRIVVASANLTPSGYRSNQEVSGTVELARNQCDQQLLEQACGFLEALIELVPGSGDDVVRRRANQFLRQVRKQAESWAEMTRRGAQLTRHLCFTLPGKAGSAEGHSSLAETLAACRRTGGAPSAVSVASPFFDPSPAAKTDSVTAELCKGMARGRRRLLTFCVPAIGETKETVRLAAPYSLWRTAIDRVNRLSLETLPATDNDKNLRPWHAKMLALRHSKYSALLIGSSNFTRAGMGIGPARNTEANLVYIARKKEYAREAGALDACWPATEPVPDPDHAEWQGPQPELIEEEQATSTPGVPAGFVSVRYRAGKQSSLVFRLNPEGLPERWRILGGPKHEEVLLDSNSHSVQAENEAVEVTWPHPHAPGKLLVVWGEEQAFWSVNVEDQSMLPVPREIETMTAQDLLYILAASDVGAAIRIVTQSKQPDNRFDEDLDDAVPPDLDPLRRHSLRNTFLHRIRRRARLLSAVKDNLERPVWSKQALEWRLTGLIGIQQLVKRFASTLQSDNGNASETVLGLADLFLALGEVRYRETEGSLSRQQFDQRYREFLQNLSGRVEREILSARGVSAEIRSFWKRVYQKIQQ